MLHWLRSRFGPRRISDPVFGSLVYMGGYWEGAGYFPPTQQEVEWFVTAGDSGPGPTQRLLFRQISERYAQLEPSVYGTLATHVAKWAEPSSAAPLSNVLRLSGLSVPEKESEDMEWELMFESTIKGEPHFVVAMKGWTPSGSVDVST